MLEVLCSGKKIPIGLTGPKGDTRMLFHFDSDWKDECGALTTSNGGFSTTNKKFGASSFNAVVGGGVNVTGHPTKYTDLTEATIEMWLYKTGSVSWSALAMQGTGPASYVGIDASPADGADIQAYAPNGSNTKLSVVLVPTNSFPMNKWTHFAACWKNKIITSFVDGKKVRSGELANWIFRPNENIYIGTLGYAQSYSFPGLMDEFRLSATSLYDTDFTPSGYPFSL